MAKIADAEARIALLEETAGIRDDASGQQCKNELDNQPPDLRLPAAQKERIPPQEPGDAKIVATLFESLIKDGATQLACHQEN